MTSDAPAISAATVAAEPLEAEKVPALHPRPLFLPLAGSIALLIAVMLVAVLVGPTAVPAGAVGRILLAKLTGVHLGHWTASAEVIVWQIRLPRIMLAGIVGATLACAGATYQGVFRNPLAEPYLIGVASGAGLGAAIAIVLPLHAVWHGIGALPAFAFAGAMLAVSLSYLAARSSGAVPATTLILAGVAIAALGNAGMSYIFLLHNEKALTILAWLLGSFNTANWQQCALVLPYVSIGCAVLLLFGRVLNVLQVGDEQARQLGLPVERVKLLLLFAASMAAAAAVSVSGLIGFVGLIVPHTLRLIWGHDYRRLLPLSLTVGAAFLVLADTLARVMARPQEVPIGVITAACGAPFFLVLLRRRQARPATP